MCGVPVVARTKAERDQVLRNSAAGVGGAHGEIGRRRRHLQDRPTRPTTARGFDGYHVAHASCRNRRSCNPVLLVGTLWRGDESPVLCSASLDCRLWRVWCESCRMPQLRRTASTTSVQHSGAGEGEVVDYSEEMDRADARRAAGGNVAGPGVRRSREEQLHDI